MYYILKLFYFKDCSETTLFERFYCSFISFNGIDLILDIYDSIFLRYLELVWPKVDEKFSY